MFLAREGQGEGRAVALPVAGGLGGRAGAGWAAQADGLVPVAGALAWGGFAAAGVTPDQPDPSDWQPGLSYSGTETFNSSGQAEFAYPFSETGTFSVSLTQVGYSGGYIHGYYRVSGSFSFSVTVNGQTKSGSSPYDSGVRYFQQSLSGTGVPFIAVTETAGVSPLSGSVQFSPDMSVITSSATGSFNGIYGGTQLNGPVNMSFSVHATNLPPARGDWGGASGSWTDNRAWTPNYVPNSPYQDTYLGGSAGYTVTLGGGESVWCRNLTMSNTQARLNLQGTMTGCGSISLQQGVVQLSGTWRAGDFSNDGTLQCTNGGLLTVDAMRATGALSIASDVGTASVYAASLSNAGNITVGAGGVLSVASTCASWGNVQILARPAALSAPQMSAWDYASNGSLAIGGNALLAVSNNFTLTGGNAVVSGTLSATAIQITSGTMRLQGGWLASDQISSPIGSQAASALVGYGSIGNTFGAAGTLSLGGQVRAAGGTLLFNAPVFGNGYFSADAGGVLQFNSGAQLNGVTGGAGTLLVHGGSLLVGDFGAVQTGLLRVDAGATLTVTQSASGTLNSPLVLSGVLASAAPGGVSGNGVMRGGGYILGGTLSLSNAFTITAGASFGGYGLLAAKGLAVSGNLIAGGGTLAVRNGVFGYGTLNAASGSVMLLDGGIFGGVMRGLGTIELIQGAGMTLLGSNALGGGTLQIDAGATIQLQGGGSIGGGVRGAGTLVLGGNAQRYTLNAGLTGLQAITVSAGNTLSITAISNGLTILNVDGTLAGGAAMSLDRLTVALSGRIEAPAGLSLGQAGTLTGSGTINGALTDNGRLEATGGTMLVAGAIAGSGVMIGSGGLISLAGGGVFSGSIAGSVALGTGAVLTIAAANVLSGGTLSFGTSSRLVVGGGGTIGASMIGSGMLQLNAGASVMGVGDAINLSAVNIASQAILTANNMRVANLVNAGVLRVNPGSVPSAAVISGTLSNNGTIVLGACTMQVSGVVNGAGAWRMSNGAQLVLSGGGSLADIAPLTSGTTAGTLSLSGGSYSLSAAQLTLKSVVLASGASLMGNGTVSGQIANGGMIGASGGTLTVSSAVSGKGIFSAAAGASLRLAGGGTVGGALGGAGQVVVSGPVLTLAAGTQLTAAEIGVSGTLKLSGAATLGSSVRLTLAAGSGTVARLSGGSGVSLSNQGSLVASGAGSDVVDLTVTNAGVVVSSAATLSFLSAVSNSGSMRVDGGRMVLAKGLTGAGTLTIGNAGTLSLGGVAGAAQTLLFAAGADGLLDLAAAGSMAASIAGFGQGDAIHLSGIAASGFKFAKNVLSIQAGTSTVASLHFGALAAGGQFSLAADGHGGTTITYGGG